jgi:hypothetical protein
MKKEEANLFRRIKRWMEWQRFLRRPWTHTDQCRLELRRYKHQQTTQKFLKYFNK